MAEQNQHLTPGELARWIVKSRGLTEEHSWKHLARSYTDLEEQYENLQRVAGKAVGDAAAWEAENRGLKEQLEAAQKALEQIIALDGQYPLDVMWEVMKIANEAFASKPVCDHSDCYSDHCIVSNQ